MTQDQWAIIKGHFDALSELSLNEQTAGLAAIVDDQIRHEVALLLRPSEDTATIAETVSIGARMEPKSITDQRVGPYRLVRRQGQGGQGAVFEAVRDDGTFQQRVAIKMVKWDVDSDAARDQFRHERQMLAGLEHPHIARLLDGGETADGTPYLVMEYVDGVPLTAATRGWPLKRKLAIFVEIAAAVSFAHRNLIVHRDLKPANILVTKDGVPKLLDFGIAKLLDTNAQQTVTGFQALTPEYASPEQVRGELITTASDVYSLGVVLYELLTNHRPYEVRTTSPMEIHRAVCLTEPPAPKVSGDLDNIILMAMRKEPARRYQSVEQFAKDIDRSLNNLPVLARPDTLPYRTGKFFRRHWVAIASVSVASLGLITGTILAVRQAQRAEHRFLQVRTMAHKFLFDFQDDIENIPGATKAREHMVATAREYLDSLAAEATGDPDLQIELATSYMRLAVIQGKPFRANLQQPQEALNNLGKAISILQTVGYGGRASARNRKVMRVLVESQGERSWVYQTLGKRGEALQNAQQAAALAAVLAADPAPTPEDLRAAYLAESALSDLKMIEPSKKESIAGFKRANELAKRLIVTGGPVWKVEYGGSFNKLGRALEEAGEQTQALDAFLAGLRVMEPLRQSDPSNIVIGRHLVALMENTGNIYWNNAVPSVNNPAKGFEYATRMKVIVEQMHAADPSDQSVIHDMVDVLGRLAALAQNSNHSQEGIALNRRALDFSDAKQLESADRDYGRSTLLMQMAICYATTGNIAKARRSLHESEELIRRQVGKLSGQSAMERNLAVVRYWEAEVALADKKPNVAATAAQSFMKTTEETFAKEPSSFYVRYDLSAGYELLAKVAAARGDEASRQKYQMKRLHLWKDWDAHFVPNPFSKWQQAEAMTSLTNSPVTAN